MTVAAEPVTHVCDCCDHERTVATPQDLLDAGWVRHQERGVLFVMCNLCEEYFTPIWERRRAQREAERRLIP